MGLNAKISRPGQISPSAAMAIRSPTRNDGTPGYADYRKRFPVGVVVGSGLGATIATWTTEVQRMKAAGFDSALHMSEQPKREDGVTEGPAFAIEAAYPDGSFSFVPVPLANIDAATNESLNVDWYPLSAGSQTTSLANSFASRIGTVYDAHPSVIALMVGDDVVASSGTAAVHTGPEAAKIITAMEARDKYGRAVFGTFRDDAASYAAVPDADRRVIMFSIYPVNSTPDGTARMPEGDFHTAGAPNPDFVDIIRSVRSGDTTGAHFWWHMQAHQTVPIANPTGPWTQYTKQYPTAAEMRLMFWILVGEGIKGMFWFTWDTFDDTVTHWDGLGAAASATRLTAATNLANRLTPSIRSRLLPSDREATNRFTVSGGGSSGYTTNYSAAYVSTLYDPVSAVRYVVIVNHAATTASITVSGTTGYTTGTLTNLESGLVTNVGSAISLPAFDGSIWKYTP